jgi:uncharacterized protein
MKHKILFFVIFFLLTGSLAFSQWTPKNVPDPKQLSGNHFVADPDSYLAFSTVQELNQICNEIKKQTGIEYAVVVLKNINYQWTVFDFAVELFSEWGIGERGHDNGLLLLIVMDTRDWRFVTGYGIEGLLTDALCRRLGENFIIPYFKENEYDEGLIAVSEKISEIVTADNKDAVVKYYMAYDSWWMPWQIGVWLIWGIIFLFALISFLRKKKYHPVKKEKLYDVIRHTNNHSEVKPCNSQKIHIWGSNRSLKFISVYMLSAIIPALTMYFDDFFSNPAKNTFIGIYGYFMLLGVIYQFLINKNVSTIADDNIEKYFTAKTANKFLGTRALFFPFLFLPYYFIHIYRMRSLKKSHITCPVCNTRSTPANDSETSSILGEKKMFEKKIKSIDHRVFSCLNLHTTEIPFPGRKDTVYKSCGVCGTKAVRQTKNRTIKAATYTSSGTGKREFTCRFCKNKSYSTYVIPRKERSSSGSSSSGSSGRSSGGSWGGGRTGGGGAGGKW